MNATFSTITFIALLSVHSFSSAQEKPSGSVQSGNQPVVISFSNTTKNNVSLLWIDAEGMPKDYGSLTPGKTVKMTSYPGHLWMLRNGRTGFGTFRITTAAKQKYATIQGGISAPTTDKPSNITKSTDITNTGSKITASEAKEMIRFHNNARKEVGVGQVTWSPEIAKFAQQWADHLARAGTMTHRPQDQQKYGENLAGGKGYANPVQFGLQNWYGEKKLYRPAGSPFSMRLMPAGHYTQMVWRGTTQIGAGKAICRTGQFRGWTIIVCNYNPRGNMIGQPAF